MAVPIMDSEAAIGWLIVVVIILGYVIYLVGIPLIKRIKKRKPRLHRKSIESSNLGRDSDAEEKMKDFAKKLVGINQPPAKAQPAGGLPSGRMPSTDGSLEVFTAGDDVIVTVPRDRKKVHRAMEMLKMLDRELELSGETLPEGQRIEKNPPRIRKKPKKRVKKKGRK